MDELADTQPWRVPVGVGGLGWGVGGVVGGGMGVVGGGGGGFQGGDPKDTKEALALSP